MDHVYSTTTEHQKVQAAFIRRKDSYPAPPERRMAAKQNRKRNRLCTKCSSQPASQRNSHIVSRAHSALQGESRAGYMSNIILPMAGALINSQKSISLNTWISMPEKTNGHWMPAL